jgi:hypothetical protein
MKTILRLAWVALVLISPVKTFGDGCFVAPKFVWDKHKDINEPSQKAILVYDAGREDLILQVKYEGPVSEFGWLIPVPNLPQVQRGSMKCFYELSQYTQRHFASERPHSQTKSGRSNAGTLDAASAGAPEPPVKVVETKTVGAYEIAVLSTKDSSALASWLETNRFYFPTNKTDVLDYYVQQQWYFIAVKINLGQKHAHAAATATELASGELNPLQISFASDRCIFPLKISSVNRTPSEIQLYVLSPEPLVEKAMLDKKLPGILSNNLAQARGRAESYKNMLLLRRSFQMDTPGTNMPLLAWEQKHIGEIREHPAAESYELPPYAKLAKNELPESAKLVTRLAGKSWWLTKQTWTFKPDEMRDLVFDPAIAFFVNKLDSTYGYYAAQTLASFHADAMPALFSAMRDSNPTVRRTAVTALDPRESDWHDPDMTREAVNWIKDSEPKVRVVGAAVLGDYSDWKPANAASLVGMLSDVDLEARWAAAGGLEHHLDDIKDFLPRFHALLKDKNPDIHACAYEVLHRMHEPVSREDLSGVFAAASMGPVWTAYEELQKNGWEISDTDVVTLLKNSDPNIRGGLGLKILYDRANRQSVDLALPFLHDPEPLVRMSAARTLRALTGQHFTEAPADDWEKWWTQNKDHFIVHQHPEELTPKNLRRVLHGDQKPLPNEDSRP